MLKSYLLKYLLVKINDGFIFRLKLWQKSHINCKHTKRYAIINYELMLLIRRFEERCSCLWNGIYSWLCHLYRPRSSCCWCKKLLRGDLNTSYRDHGHVLACGSDPNIVMAELFRNTTGKWFVGWFTYLLIP